jgi:hypothetical protein
MSLGVFSLFFVMIVVRRVLESEENVARFMGGPYWQALAYAIWETFLMIGIIVFLLYFFRERLNQAGSLAKSMASSVFFACLFPLPAQKGTVGCLGPARCKTGYAARFTWGIGVPS